MSTFMADQSLPPAPPQMSEPEAGFEDASLEGYREAVLCYAKLCTSGPAEAEQLTDEAFTLAVEWRRQGEELPWLPLLLMAVLETADAWLTQGHGEWLSAELSVWSHERAAQRSRDPEQQPLALRALQRMPSADAELLWASQVEGLDTRSDARTGTWAPNREREVARVKEVFRRRCMWVRAIDVVDSHAECRGYLGLLEATTRSPHERSPHDLQRHLAGCARCGETAACLRVYDDLPRVLVTAVLSWGGEAYLDRRKIAARTHRSGSAYMTRRHRAAGWQASLRGRPAWAGAVVLLAAIGMIIVLGHDKDLDQGGTPPPGPTTTKSYPVVQPGKAAGAAPGVSPAAGHPSSDHGPGPAHTVGVSATVTSSVTKQSSDLAVQTVVKSPNGYWSQSQVTVTTTKMLSALKVVVHIAQTGGVANTGVWTSLGDKATVHAAKASDGGADYVVTLDAGITLDFGTYVFQFGYNHDKGTRETVHDLYAVVATGADDGGSESRQGRF